MAEEPTYRCILEIVKQIINRIASFDVSRNSIVKGLTKFYSKPYYTLVKRRRRNSQKKKKIVKEIPLKIENCEPFID